MLALGVPAINAQWTNTPLPASPKGKTANRTSPHLRPGRETASRICQALGTSQRDHKIGTNAIRRLTSRHMKAKTLTVRKGGCLRVNVLANLVIGVPRLALPNTRAFRIE
jgi:hypothetical protein